MPRFAVTAQGDVVDVAFDDGGMNLLSSDALRELREVVAGLPSCRVARFRSARSRLFAAGADMSEMRSFTARDAEVFSRLGQELFAAIEKLPVITVAEIDGDCFGGALDLALAFDLRFATPRSRFSHPGSKLGIVTGFGGTTRWRRALARGAANRLFLGNEVLSAADAQALGLVDRVADTHDDELARLASLDPRMTLFVKELSARADRLSKRELALLAERLGSVYFAP